jgi:hypothetical protein
MHSTDMLGILVYHRHEKGPEAAITPSNKRKSKIDWGRSIKEVQGQLVIRKIN